MAAARLGATKCLLSTPKETFRETKSEVGFSAIRLRDRRVSIGTGQGCKVRGFRTTHGYELCDASVNHASRATGSDPFTDYETLSEDR